MTSVDRCRQCDTWPCSCTQDEAPDEGKSQSNDSPLGIAMVVIGPLAVLAIIYFLTR